MRSLTAYYQLIIGNSPSASERRSTWNAVNAAYESYQEVDNSQGCDDTTEQLSDAADSTQTVFALGNGSLKQDSSMLSAALNALISSSIYIGKAPYYTSDLYDWLLRRLIDMFRNSHYRLPDNVCTDQLAVGQTYLKFLQQKLPDVDFSSMNECYE